MKAISVRQPYASCIAVGEKLVENRGQQTHYRGPIAIHASKAASLFGDTDPRVVQLFGRDPRLGMPVGQVIAVAELVDCHEVAADARGWCCQPWGEQKHNGRPAWHLVLADVRVLLGFIPATGSLAVPWTLPEVVAAAVEAKLPAAI